MPRHPTILVGTDLSALADVGVQAAGAIARRLKSRRLHIVSVIDMAPPPFAFPSSYSDEHMVSIQERSRERVWRKLAEIAVDAGRAEITREVRRGKPAWELVRVAEEISADLLVTATHGFGALKRALLGSVATALAQTAPCPVLAVGKERAGLGPFAKVLVGVDFSEGSKRLLESAVDLAEPGGVVRALFVHDLPVTVFGGEGLLPVYLGAEDLRRMEEDRLSAIEEMAATVEARDVAIEAAVESRALPADAILQDAERFGADLIAVGTSGHGAWHRMVLGSTTTKVLAHAPVPVLVVPRIAQGG